MLIHNKYLFFSAASRKHDHIPARYYFYYFSTFIYAYVLYFYTCPDAGVRLCIYEVYKYYIYTPIYNVAFYS